MVYIAPQSIKYLDEHENSKKIKVFVICACDTSNNPWHRSISCALKDNIPAYRLPLEKHTM